MKIFLTLSLAFVALASSRADQFFNETVSNTPIAVRVGKGQLYGWNIISTNTSPVYVHFYNQTVDNVTVGTTTQSIAPLAIPGPGAYPFPQNNVPQGAFDTAITIAVTTSPLSSVSTAPTTPIIVQLFHKN